MGKHYFPKPSKLTAAKERIDEMIQKKKHLAEMTVATGENWIGKLSNRELREIFG